MLAFFRKSRGLLVFHKQQEVVFCLLMTIFLGLFLTNSASADNTSSRNRLFNSAAVEKANQRQSVNNARSFEIRQGTKGIGDFDQELNLDTVDTILYNKENETKLRTAYRSITYLSYLNNWFDSGEIDDLEERSLAEKLLFYQSAKSLGEYLISSPLEQTYRSVLRSLGKVRDYTTVEVKQGGQGKIDIAQGASSQSKLMDFRISATARDGIQPRLTIVDQIALKYNFFESATLLEFRLDF